MEENLPVLPKPAKTNAKKPKQEVYVLRSFKEYLGESALIIFSVLLALFLTEFINNLHEKTQTNELLANIKAELIKNKKAEEEQYLYQQIVLKRIDTAINNPELQRKIFSNGEFNFELIFPKGHGVLYRDLNKVAWQVAQSQNIFPKINFKLVEQLTAVYDDQDKIGKLEDKMGSVLLSYESRNVNNARETLILIRDNYKGWAYDRAPALIEKYDAAIKTMNKQLGE
jgi:hypothetical protein